MFAMNQWYAIASHDEVKDELLARMVCGKHLVLFRTSDGTAVALDDSCSHRNYPLSAGALIDDKIQCGYHGLQFSCAGTCVWAPGQDRIPSKANVSAHPLAESGPWLWVWLGDPDTPDYSKLPSIPWYEDLEWDTVHGMELLPSRYSLLVDNLLDLSHETFLHAGFIGTPEVADTPIETSVDEEAEIIRVQRRMKSVDCPPFYTESTGLQSPIDRWQDVEYHPTCFYLLHVRVAPVGSVPNEDGTDPDGALLKVLYAITPIDKNNTMDFWGLCRNFAIGDEGVSAFLSKMNREVVLQDVVALSMIEDRLGDNFSPDEVSFKIDAGGLAARRMLARQIAAQPQHSDRTTGVTITL